MNMGEFMKLQLVVNNSADLSYDQVCSKILSHEIMLDCMNSNGISEDFPLFEFKLTYLKNLQNQIETKELNQEKFKRSSVLNKIFDFFLNRKYSTVDHFEIKANTHHVDGELLRLEFGWDNNDENILPTNFFIAKGTNRDGQVGAYSSLTQLQIEMIGLIIDQISYNSASAEATQGNLIKKENLFLELQSQNKTKSSKGLEVKDNVIELCPRTYVKTVPEVG